MIVGGTFIGSVSAALFGQGALRTMSELSKDLKIWAAVAAIGGTFDSLQAPETGLLAGQMRLVLKQLGFMVKGEPSIIKRAVSFVTASFVFDHFSQIMCILSGGSCIIRVSPSIGALLK